MQNMPLSVRFQTQTTDAGLCLLKYTHLLASMDIDTLNNQSFDNDGRENTLGKMVHPVSVSMQCIISGLTFSN